MNSRIFNTILRAEKDYGYEYNIEDSLVDIWQGAENAIMEQDVPDYIEECESDNHETISWFDGKEFTYNASGEFISSDTSRNTYYRKDYTNGCTFHEIPWYEANEDDYVLMDKVIDTDGQLVFLVAK